MIERKIKKRLKKAVIIGICIVMAFIIFGILFYSYLGKTRDQIREEQITSEAEEYRTRIIKQLRSDFQTLSVLAALIKGDYGTDAERLAEQLSETLEYSDFVNLVYFDKDGSGIIAGRDGVVMDAELSDLSPEGQEGVRAALEGEASVSRLFESVLSHSQVFVYSVPVYDGDEVAGVFSASDHIDIFSDIIEGNTVLGGGGYIHMINADGEFLIKSSKMVVQEDISSIFDGPYLSQTSQESTREALADGNQLFSFFTYNGAEYSFLLEPVGINNWYLLCVNTGEGLNAMLDRYTQAAWVMFAAAAAFAVLLILYGFRLFSQYNKEMLVIAYNDELTGAENMTRFRQRLADVLVRSGGCVAAISIRQFPFLTEVFGTATIGRFLRNIKEVVDERLHDNEFFCRDTEDRFYLFLREAQEEVILIRLNDMIKELERYKFGDRTDYQVSIYCGVTIANPDVLANLEAENMLTRIHFALDKAKEGHGSTVWFFDSELHKQEELENYIESHMYHALQNGEFKMFLQPKVWLNNGELIGAEALVRWRTSGGRTVFPNQFIPQFERNGFCVNLDFYMVEQACRQVREWLDAGIRPIPISVNQSKLLIFKRDYVQRLSAIIDKYEVPANMIILEILEDIAMENMREVNDKIRQLHAIGFKVSLDDFGSGYSSLNTLGNLNIDEIKLDRGFLMDAEEYRHGRVRLVMEEIIRLAHRLGIYAVAEGVETSEDVSMLQNIGCEVGQGYFYSRPLWPDDFNAKYMLNRQMGAGLGG